MAQFDFYTYGNGYLLDVQSDLLDRLNTRIVVPMWPVAESPRQPVRLNPVFLIDGSEFVFLPQYLSAVSVSELGVVKGSMKAQYDEIRSALDMVFIGF